MPNKYLSVLYKHIIQVENKNVGLKVWGGGGKSGTSPIAPPPPPLPTPVCIYIYVYIYIYIYIYIYRLYIESLMSCHLLLNLLHELANMILIEALPSIISFLPTNVINLVINDNEFEILFIT